MQKRAKIGRPPIPKEKRLVSLTVRITQEQAENLAKKDRESGEIIRNLLSLAGYGKSE